MISKRISRQERETLANEKKSDQKDFDRYYENIPTVEEYSFMLKPGESSRGRVSWATVEEDNVALREAISQSELRQSELRVCPMPEKHR